MPIAEEIARYWCERAKRNKKDQLIFTVVLSGGNTATRLYGKLAEPKWRDQIPWESVHIFFADERCVPTSNDESNYKIICDHFINHISIPETNVHRIRGEENPQKESLRYAKDIQNHLALRKKGTGYFDWVLLGVGSDGHTASLFPNQHFINSTRLCEAVQHPKSGQERITLTPVAINNSLRITYHVLGEEKSEIIFKIASDTSPKNIYPASQIDGDWFLDRDAASKIDS